MKQWNTKKIAMLGVLVALQITASRLLGINLSPSLRLSISDSFILLAGIWFGPVGGALTGGLADLTGCLLKGEAYLPITQEQKHPRLWRRDRGNQLRDLGAVPFVGLFPGVRHVVSRPLRAESPAGGIYGNRQHDGCLRPLPQSGHGYGI